jgi:hypothetical protein
MGVLICVKLELAIGRILSLLDLPVVRLVFGSYGAVDAASVVRWLGAGVTIFGLPLDGS